MSLSAGRLRHRVDIQDVTYTQDAETGEMTPTWATVHSHIPCAIEPLSVRDYIQSRAAQSEVVARFVIRYRTGITPTMRLLAVCTCHNGRIYNPAGWLEDPDSGLEYLTAPCSEGVNNG
jgi:SPP1 family predicted phage head-tail adaptor